MCLNSLNVMNWPPYSRSPYLGFHIMHTCSWSCSQVFTTNIVQSTPQCIFYVSWLNSKQLQTVKSKSQMLRFSSFMKLTFLHIEKYRKWPAVVLAYVCVKCASCHAKYWMQNNAVIDGTLLAKLHSRKH